MRKLRFRSSHVTSLGFRNPAKSGRRRVFFPATAGDAQGLGIKGSFAISALRARSHMSQWPTIVTTGVDAASCRRRRVSAAAAVRHCAVLGGCVSAASSCRRGLLSAARGRRRLVGKPMKPTRPCEETFAAHMCVGLCFAGHPGCAENGRIAPPRV